MVKSFVNYKFVFTKSSTNCNQLAFDYVIIPKTIRQSILSSSIGAGSRTMGSRDVIKSLLFSNNGVVTCLLSLCLTRGDTILYQVCMSQWYKSPYVLVL